MKDFIRWVAVLVMVLVCVCLVDLQTAHAGGCHGNAQAVVATQAYVAPAAVVALPQVVYPVTLPAPVVAAPAPAAIHAPAAVTAPVAVYPQAVQQINAGHHGRAAVVVDNDRPKVVVERRGLFRQRITVK